MFVDVSNVRVQSAPGGHRTDAAPFKQEAALESVSLDPRDFSCTGDIAADFLIPVGSQNFHLAVNITSGTLQLVELVEAPLKCNLPRQNRLEVHHTFFAPCSGIALATYDQHHGTIAVVSPMRRRTVTVTFYQFSQNRHAVALHVLLA